MKRLIYWLKVFVTPACWIQNNNYNHVWEKELRRLLKTENFTSIQKHTAMLGGKMLWIANHPYASFSPYRPEMNIRAKRATILEAYDKLVVDNLKQLVITD